LERCKVSAQKGEDINIPNTIQFLSNTKSLIERENESRSLKYTQRKDLKAIKELKSNEDLAICKTDKTNRFVALDFNRYKELTKNALGELENKRSIKPISLQQKFNKALSTLANKFPNSVKQSLVSNKCTEPLPKLPYGLPKDHKPGNLKCRPIVSNKGSASENLCIWLVKELKPLLDYIPAHLKSTAEFISLLPTTLPENTEFGSLDVQNLYGSIPLTDSENSPSIYRIVSQFIYEHRDETVLYVFSIDDVVSLLRLCLDFDSIFNDHQQCVQLKGLPMGNNLAHFAAIIYMHHVEQKLTETAGQNLKLFCRYIDDIFFIVDETLSSEGLLEMANSLNNNIKFTLEKPNEEKELSFLDVKVKYGPNLSTALFIKPFHSNVIMNYNSAVPKDRKVNLLQNEIKRVKQNSSNVMNERKSIDLITNRFRLNKYPLTFINKYKAQRDPPNESLEPITYVKVPFLNEKTTQKIRKYLRDANLQGKIRLVFTTQPPLHRLLAPKKETIECEESCVACITAKKPGSCKKKNVIYQIQCQLCNFEYIGESKRCASTRIMEHTKSEMSNVYQHFTLSHPTSRKDNFKWSIIAQEKDWRTRTACESMFAKKKGLSQQSVREIDDCFL